MAVLDRKDESSDPRKVYILDLISVGNRFNKSACIEILKAFLGSSDSEACAIYTKCVENSIVEIHRSTNKASLLRIKEDLESQGFVTRESSY